MMRGAEGGKHGACAGYTHQPRVVGEAWMDVPAQIACATGAGEALGGRSGRQVSGEYDLRRGARLPAADRLRIYAHAYVERIGAVPGDTAERQRQIRMTLRLESPDNEFAGIVSLVVAAEYLTAFHNERVLGRHGLVALAGEGA